MIQKCKYITYFDKCKIIIILKQSNCVLICSNTYTEWLYHNNYCSSPADHLRKRL